MFLQVRGLCGVWAWRCLGQACKTLHGVDMYSWNAAQGQWPHLAQIVFLGLEASLKNEQPGILISAPSQLLSTANHPA